MGEREDNVYKAKLAEQAERYDGKFFFFKFLSWIFSRMKSKSHIIWKKFEEGALFCIF